MLISISFDDGFGKTFALKIGNSPSMLVSISFDDGFGETFALIGNSSSPLPTIKLT